jgi:hypothetical protein
MPLHQASNDQSPQPLTNLKKGLDEQLIKTLFNEAVQLQSQTTTAIEEFAIGLDEQFTHSTAAQRTAFVANLLNNVPADHFHRLTLAVLTAEMQRVNHASPLLSSSSLAQSLLIARTQLSLAGPLTQVLLEALSSPPIDLLALQLELRNRLVTEQDYVPSIIAAFQSVKNYHEAQPHIKDAAVQAAHLLLSSVIQIALTKIITTSTDSNEESLQLTKSLLELTKPLSRSGYMVATTAWLINGRQGPEPMAENFSQLPQTSPSPQQNWRKFNHVAQAMQAAILGKTELLDVLISSGVDESIHNYEVELQDLLGKRSLIELDIFIIEAQLAELKKIFSPEGLVVKNITIAQLQQRLDNALQTAMKNFANATAATLERGDIINDDGSTISGKQGAEQYIANITTEVEYTHQQRIIIVADTNFLQLQNRLQEEHVSKLQHLDECVEKSTAIGMKRADLDIFRTDMKARQGILFKNLLENNKADLPTAYQIDAHDEQGLQAIVGADVAVNACDSETGNSLLHLAAKHGHKEIVELLIKRGADILLLNQRQQTPLHFAVKNAEPTPILEHIVTSLKSVDLIQRNAANVLTQLKQELESIARVKTLIDTFGANVVRIQKWSGIYKIFTLAKKELKAYTAEYESYYVALDQAIKNNSPWSFLDFIQKRLPREPEKGLEEAFIKFNKEYNATYDRATFRAKRDQAIVEHGQEKIRIELEKKNAADVLQLKRHIVEINRQNERKHAERNQEIVALKAERNQEIVALKAESNQEIAALQDQFNQFLLGSAAVSSIAPHITKGAPSSPRFNANNNAVSSSPRSQNFKSPRASSHDENLKQTRFHSSPPSTTTTGDEKSPRIQVGKSKKYQCRPKQLVSSGSDVEQNNSPASAPRTSQIKVLQGSAKLTNSVILEKSSPSSPLTNSDNVEKISAVSVDNTLFSPTTEQKAPIVVRPVSKKGFTYFQKVGVGKPLPGVKAPPPLVPPFATGSSAETPIAPKSS